MTGDISRAVGYLLVGSLAFVAPVLEGRVDDTLAAVGTVSPFVLLATIALASKRGPMFEFFARHGDRKAERLYSLASFALAVCALAVLFAALDLPLAAFVASVFVLTAGNLGQRLAAARVPAPIVSAAAFCVLGTAAGVAAVFVAGALGGTVPARETVVFATASGAIVGAIVRATLSPFDDTSVLLSVALVVWFLLVLAPVSGPTPVAVGLAATVALGYAAYALGTASTTGTLSGVLLSLWAVVLGGYGWFALLVTFFGLGGLASKYRYDEKLKRGIAEENEGARDGSNVLANSAVALLAVVAYAASGTLGVDPLVFQFVFAGAVAAALADTFSSEFGGLFDSPRLVTTLDPVPAGTDGAVTWQGALAGGIGAGLIATLAVGFFAFGPAAALVVLGTGFLGMVVDSVLGATLEGGRVGNQSVNLLATLSAGVVAGTVAVASFV